MLLPCAMLTHWAAADGTKDDEGYSIVVVQATGNHTGKPFALPGMPPVSAQPLFSEHTALLGGSALFLAVCRLHVGPMELCPFIAPSGKAPK